MYVNYSRICECGHDEDQHVKSGPHEGECLASDRLGYSVCRCDKFIQRDSIEERTQC